MTAEVFLDDLMMFSKEIDDTAQAFYTYLAIEELVNSDGKAREVVTKDISFWALQRESLLSVSFIKVSRICGDSGHTFDKFLKEVIGNKEIFSSEALAERLRDRFSSEADLNLFLASSWAPSQADLQRLYERFAHYKKMHDEVYEPIRSRVVAHIATKKDSEVSAMMRKVSVADFHNLLYVAYSVCGILENLFRSGIEPPAGDTVVFTARDDAKQTMANILQSLWRGYQLSS